MKYKATLIYAFKFGQFVLPKISSMIVKFECKIDMPTFERK